MQRDTQLLEAKDEAYKAEQEAKGSKENLRQACNSTTKCVDNISLLRKIRVLLCKTSNSHRLCCTILPDQRGFVEPKSRRTSPREGIGTNEARSGLW